MNGTCASIDGIDLCHVVHGAGRPLVVRHGGVMDVDTCFRAMTPPAVRGPQVIAVDLPLVEPFLAVGV